MFSGFNGMEIFFLICAVVGAFFVVVKMIMQFLGGETDTDLHDGAVVDAHHTDSDFGFKLLSLHGLTSFLMMFGMVGLAFYRQSRAGLLISLAGATLAGLATVWLIGKLFRLAVRLQSSGTLGNEGTVGSSGTVWDSAGGNGDGTATSNFLSGLIKSLPPLHDVAGMAGIELPKYLGEVSKTERPGGK